jgi:hypothetical protein
MNHFFIQIRYFISLYWRLRSEPFNSKETHVKELKKEGEDEL